MSDYWSDDVDDDGDYGYEDEDAPEEDAPDDSDEDEQHEQDVEDHQDQADQADRGDDPPHPQPNDSYDDWSSDDDRDIVYGPGPGQGQPSPHEPTPGDVFLVKRRIQNIGKLPTEIVDIIIDHAEYWPHTHAHVRYEDPNGLSAYAGRNNGSLENQFLCRTAPLGFTDAYPGNPDDAQRYATEPTEPRPLPNQDAAHPGFDTTCLPETIRTWLPSVDAHLTERPCRKIVFTIVSRDQGWASDMSNRGTYTGSYTWFDVGLERYGRKAGGSVTCRPGTIPEDAQLYPILPELDQSNTAYRFPFMPDEECLMRNKVATKVWTSQTVEWSWMDSTPAEAPEQATHPLHGTGRGLATGNGRLLRNLRIGDVITVWAKARFPGWTNHVQSVDVKVYWAV